MRNARYVLTVSDPTRRGSVLAVHADLSRTDARELLAVYGALGYPPDRLDVAPQAETGGRKRKAAA